MVLNPHGSSVAHVPCSHGHIRRSSTSTTPCRDKPQLVQRYQQGHGTGRTKRTLWQVKQANQPTPEIGRTTVSTVRAGYETRPIRRKLEENCRCHGRMTAYVDAHGTLDNQYCVDRGRQVRHTDSTQETEIHTPEGHGRPKPYLEGGCRPGQQVPEDPRGPATMGKAAHGKTPHSCQPALWPEKSWYAQRSQRAGGHIGGTGEGARCALWTVKQVVPR
jgi:hypothetical protein